MKNELVINSKELKMIEDSIEAWRETMEDRQKAMQIHADIFCKIRENVSNPDFSDNVKLDNGAEAMVPMQMIRDNPEIIDMMEKQVNGSIKPSLYYKEIAFTAIKKLHNINKFIEGFDELQLTKVKEEIAELTETK